MTPAEIAYAVQRIAARLLPAPPSPPETPPMTSHTMYWYGSSWRCPTCGREVGPALGHPLGIEVLVTGDATASHILRNTPPAETFDDAPPPAWLRPVLERIAGET